MINESLRAHDLRNFIKKVFEIDSFKSKIGDDDDIVTMSFTVGQEEPAKDLERFIEMGYPFVLDADVSPGETDDGNYKVYVELERTRHAAKQIREILDGIEKLSGMHDFRFRYLKSFRSVEASLENLEAAIPADSAAYREASEKHSINNYSNFFVDSNSDKVDVTNESITFKRLWADPLTFEIISSGPKHEVYDSLRGPIMLEHKDISEVLYLTKSIGNYNITKIGNTFVFENKGWAVALERQ
jgi:hypothetical protein